MHVNRIYGGAIWGGAAAGAIIGFGTCVIIGVVSSTQFDGAAGIIRGIGGGIALGIFGVFVGAILGLAVGIGSSVAAALVTLAIRLLGEQVSGTMMIITGAAGTVPAMGWLTFWLRDTYWEPSGLGVLLAFGAIAVVATAAAVCLNWLFSPNRRFGIPLPADDAKLADDPARHATA